MTEREDEWTDSAEWPVGTGWDGGAGSLRPSFLTRMALTSPHLTPRFRAARGPGGLPGRDGLMR